jgi:hypothetical protein
MKKDQPSQDQSPHSAQDYDRKTHRDPSNSKDHSRKQDDKRSLARQEHTNHFTNRFSDHSR